MNYGKNQTRQREEELLSKSILLRKKFSVIFCKALLICFFAILVVGGCAAIGVIRGILDSAPSIDAIDATPTGYLTTVLDADGNETAKLIASGSNRKYVTIDEIPANLQHAFVAIEDERFYEHNGIDLRGILRAGVVGITSGSFSEGASTITQQLLKNTVLSEDWASESSFADKVERKIQEQYLAIQLEKMVDKDWILENYLNTINLGQNTLGVEVASERYFGKDVSDLALSECAVLAAITQKPTYYNPILHPENNRERFEKVLTNMRDQEYVSQEEYEDALSDNVYDRIQLVNIDSGSESVNSYFVDELTEQVMDDLINRLGYTETQAYKALYQGGLVIESTQDPAIQRICDTEINNEENYSSAPKVSFSYRVSIQSPDGTVSHYSEQTMLSYYQAGDPDKSYNINFASEEDARAAIEEYKADIMKPGDAIVDGSETLTFTLQPQAACTVIEQSTGAVKALVGGRGDKIANKTLNRATDTTRQPGSTFKIIASYAPALDAGGMTLASVQDDAPYTYGTGEGASVRNYDGRYRGFTTVREAITKSINIVTVKTLAAIGPSLGYEYIRNFGITTVGLDESGNETLALGGLTNGVTNLELTAAYATIANDGEYIKPRFYDRILDHEGNVLLDNTVYETREVLRPTTAWLLTNAMQDVMTKGTGTPAYFGSSMAQAGKSGTTTKSRDALFAGYTPYYTCVVWGGFDDNASQTEVGQNTTYPKTIWKSIMSQMHDGLPYRDFEQPDGIVAVSVCKESGKLPIGGVCSSDPRGSCVITEYFEEGTQPTSYCDHHIQANICTESGQIASPNCPSTQAGAVFVTGGSSATEDAPYLLPSATCAIHGGAAAPPADAANPGDAAQPAPDGQQPAPDAQQPVPDAQQAVPNAQQDGGGQNGGNQNGSDVQNGSGQNGGLPSLEDFLQIGQ